MNNTIRKIRLAIAKALWPKEVRQGDLFTVVRILRMGALTDDGSWVGKTLKAHRVDGDRIQFVELEWWNQKPCSHWLVPGVNCIVKPVAVPLTPAEAKALYNSAKGI